MQIKLNSIHNTSDNRCVQRAEARLPHPLIRDQRRRFINEIVTLLDTKDMIHGLAEWYTSGFGNTEDDPDESQDTEASVD